LGELVAYCRLIIITIDYFVQRIRFLQANSNYSGSDLVVRQKSQAAQRKTNQMKNDLNRNESNPPTEDFNESKNKQNTQQE
jgi:hypothetical protein